MVNGLAFVCFSYFFLCTLFSISCKTPSGNLAWNSVDISVQDAISKDVNIWKVSNLNRAHLAGNVTHYVRKEARCLYDDLSRLSITGNEANGRAMWVDGCPGVGKSTTLFGWGLHQATIEIKEKKKVLWVHFEKERYYLLKIEKGNGMECTLAGEKWAQIEVLAKSFDIVLLDGVKEHMKTLFATIYELEHCVVVACTSYQSGGYNPEADDKISYTTHHMDSWTLEQYKEAKIAGVILPDDLEQAYFYGGGSIRYLLWEIDALKTRFAKYVERVEKPTTLLSGVQGVMSAPAVNALMQRFGNHTCVVSQYALRLLSTKVDMEFVSAAEGVFTENPSWQGWVLELKFMVMCKIGDVTVELENDKVTWKHSGSITSWDGTDIEPGTLANNTWIIPGKWNQGCFDAIYFYQQGKVDIIQVTRATENHEYKFRHIEPFIQNLANTKGKCSIRFIVVVSEHNVKTFKISDGDLKDIDVANKFHKGWSSKRMFVGKLCSSAAVDATVSASKRRKRN